MSQDAEQHASVLQDVSNALVRLHKDQYGRGPTRARSDFAGPDVCVCVLEDVLLPAERKMVEVGDADHVRQARQRFQVVTADEFISAVESIVGRKVRSFASGIDPAANVVFETFLFESVSA